MRLLLDSSSCWTAAHGINSSSYSWQPFSHPHTQWFISQLELTVSSQEYLKELRILLFQRALYKLPSRDVLKKGNYYFFYNNYICFKSLYAHDKVVFFSCWIFLFRSYVTQICSALSRRIGKAGSKCPSPL
jgi:hypothetical protein